MTTVTVNTRLYSHPYSDEYSPGMVKRVLVGVGDFRLLLKRWLSAAERGQQHTVVANRGRVTGVYVPYSWYVRAATALDEVGENGEISMSPADVTTKQEDAAS